MIRKSSPHLSKTPDRNLNRHWELVLGCIKVLVRHPRVRDLGRSLKCLIETVTKLQGQGIAFQSITENINTETSTGQLVFHIFGALAEFERNLIRERTIAGLEAARARGRFGGRPKVISKSSKWQWQKNFILTKQRQLRTFAKLCISHEQLYTGI